MQSGGNIPSLLVLNRMLLHSATALAVIASSISPSITLFIQFPYDKIIIYPFYHLRLVVSQM